MDGLTNIAVESGSQKSSDDLKPYDNDTDFLSDLAKVLEVDYGVSYLSLELKEVGRNIDTFLRALL